MTKKRLYIISISIFTALIAAILFTACFKHNSSSIAQQKLADEISALEENLSSLDEQKAELNQQISDIETELSTKNTINNYYMEYQKTHDELEEEITELKEQSAELDADIELKQKELGVFSGLKDETTGKSYTLKKDELYTCPDKIPAGRYIAVGSGSIIISSSSGKTRATENLDVAYNNSYTFNLSENEQIKVTGNVKLTELK